MNSTAPLSDTANDQPCGSAIPVRFVSTWEEGEVTTRATLNTDSGAIEAIEIANQGDDFEHLIDERIETLDGQVTAHADYSPERYCYLVLDQVALAHFRASRL